MMGTQFTGTKTTIDAVAGSQKNCAVDNIKINIKKRIWSEFLKYVERS